jgi:hypothetical protein
MYYIIIMNNTVDIEQPFNLFPEDEMIERDVEKLNLIYTKMLYAGMLLMRPDLYPEFSIKHYFRLRVMKKINIDNKDVDYTRIKRMMWKRDYYMDIVRRR